MKPFTRPIVGLVTFFLLLAPISLLAAPLSAGVPRDPIWFSKEPFFDGEEITVFAPLYNSSPYRFSGMVALHDGATTIGEQRFTLLPGGASTVIAFPWKATRGDHAFSVSVIGGEFVSDDKELVELPISKTTTNATNRFVDKAPPVLVSTVRSIEETLSPEETPAIQYLSTKIPASIAQQILPLLGGVEVFRVNQATRANDMVSAQQTTLVSDGVPLKKESGWKTLSGGWSAGGIIHSPWGYTKLFFVLCYQFLTTNVYAFYVFCSYSLYLVVRIAISVIG